ncbi:transposase [Bradyrhizobium sp. USDA 4451]
MITETGRRRWFSKDDRARIVEEALVPGAVVSEIARRHGLSPQQVFTWRRRARRLPTPMAGDLPFVPAVVDAMAPVAVAGHERKTARRKPKPDARARHAMPGHRDRSRRRHYPGRPRRGHGDDCVHPPCDLPLNFHPAAVRVSVVCTPSGAGGATDDRRSWSGLRSRASVAVRVAA